MLASNNGEKSLELTLSHHASGNNCLHAAKHYTKVAELPLYIQIATINLDIGDEVAIDWHCFPTAPQADKPSEQQQRGSHKRHCTLYGPRWDDLYRGWS